MTADYSVRLKRDILQLATQQLPCCQESFILGMCRGKNSEPFIRVRRQLKGSMKRFFRQQKKVVLEFNNKILKVKNTDQLAMREKFVERVRRTSDPGSSKHCQIGFLRGLFVAGGYIQNPGKGYHFEFRLQGRWLAAAFRKIVFQLRLKFGVYQNGSDLCFYMKSGRRIAKLLNQLGLFEKALELSDLTATRKLLSMVNRQVNFETANINRVISAAEESITQIRALFDHHDQEIWTENLRQLSLMRLKFPHDSIETLGKRFDPPLSKSAVNHRLRRIKALYRRVFPPRTAAETDS